MHTFDVIHTHTQAVKQSVSTLYHLVLDRRALCPRSTNRESCARVYRYDTVLVLLIVVLSYNYDLMQRGFRNQCVHYPLSVAIVVQI